MKGQIESRTGEAHAGAQRFVTQRSLLRVPIWGSGSILSLD